MIHRGDWNEIVNPSLFFNLFFFFQRFPIDHTSYLSESKEGKVLNLINGMDSVPHDDILPLDMVSSSEGFKSPIDHDLFSTLFKLADESRPGL